MTPSRGEDGDEQVEERPLRAVTLSTVFPRRTNTAEGLNICQDEAHALDGDPYLNRL